MGTSSCRMSKKGSGHDLQSRMPPQEVADLKKAFIVCKILLNKQIHFSFQIDIAKVEKFQIKSAFIFNAGEEESAY